MPVDGRSLRRAPLRGSTPRRRADLCRCSVSATRSELVGLVVTSAEKSESASMLSAWDTRRCRSRPMHRRRTGCMRPEPTRATSSPRRLTRVRRRTRSSAWPRACCRPTAQPRSHAAAGPSPEAPQPHHPGRHRDAIADAAPVEARLPLARWLKARSELRLRHWP